MARKLYDFTTEQDALLLQRYDSTDSRAITELVDLLGYPRHTVTQRARKLGLGRSKEPDWSEEDVDYLIENYGKVDDRTLCHHLGRTRIAVQLKAKRLGISRKLNIITLRDVARLFGVDEHLVLRWIREGYLQATKSPIGCGGGDGRMWDVDGEAIERFIAEFPWMFDLRRMSPGECWTNLAEKQQFADPWLTTDEADRLLRLPEHTVARYLSRGWLEGGRRAYGEGGHRIWKIKRSDARRFRWRRSELVGHRGRDYALEAVS